MNSSPRVTVITPSFNQAHFLEQAVLSVLEQDYPNLEYIIMDGGSTDGSANIIEKYASRLAYWISEPDAGQSAAINKGLYHGTGEIWAWMNADDAYLPGAVSAAVAWLLANQEYLLVYGDCLQIDQGGRPIGYHPTLDFSFPSLLMGKSIIPSGSTFIKRELSDKIGGLNETMHFAFDTEYWLRAGLTSALGHLPKPLSLYRIYPGAKTWDVAQSERRACEIVDLMERFWARVDLPNTIKPFRSRLLAGTYLYAADLALQADNRHLCSLYIRKGKTFGLAMLQPRLARLIVHFWFGAMTAHVLRKLVQEVRHIRFVSCIALLISALTR